MKTLSQLTAVAQDAEYSGNGTRHTVHLEPRKGVFVRVTLAATGVYVSNPITKSEVAIPLAEIVSLAQVHCPSIFETKREMAARSAREPAAIEPPTAEPLPQSAPAPAEPTTEPPAN